MHKPSIVVVEACSAMRLLLDDFLSGAGYKTYLWPDSRGAFAFIRQKRPALVILALSLKQHGDGLALFNQLCYHQAMKDTAIIVFADDSLAVSTLPELPVAARLDVLEKPFYLDQLMAKVRLAVEPIRTKLDDSAQNGIHHREALAIGG